MIWLLRQNVIITMTKNVFEDKPHLIECSLSCMVSVTSLIAVTISYQFAEPILGNKM